MGKTKMNGFTMMEVLTTLSVVAVLFIVAIPTFRIFQRNTDLGSAVEDITSSLRKAQSKALASDGASQWGVYFSTSTDPHTFTVFKGMDYASRASSSDQVRELVNTDISQIDLAGSGSEVVFSRVTGDTGNPGSVTLELKTDTSRSTTIYINGRGQINTDPFTAPSDTQRITDSRHIHVDYSRVISTSTESVDLTFDGSVVRSLPIAENLLAGEFYAEEEVDVGGETQLVLIHTHRLNDPDTVFCVHRDRRYNNKSLDIDISADAGATPNLIGYDSDGNVTAGSSIYSSSPVWQ